MDFASEIKQLASQFSDCGDILTAIGDENRLALIVDMMQMGECDGVCVGDIAKRSHLSRPAISHHLKILKDAGILQVRSVGTKNYYYFSKDQAGMKKLVDALNGAIKLASEINR